MYRSPGLNEIGRLEGDGSAIWLRGRAIERLGGYMTDAADILQAVKNSGDGQYGDAVDALREEIGDAFQVLRQAGELYTPVGPVIAEYGDAVRDVQPRIDAKVEDCESLWAAYEALPGSLYGPRSTSDDEDEQAAQDEYAAKLAAYQRWEDAAREYDSLYYSWSFAYEQAEFGIKDGMAGKIRDPNGWLDALNGIVEVLGWVAFGLAILAIVFAGPFVALAAIVGGLILVLTVVQYALGEATLADLGWALVGVLPFAKLGTLFKGGVGGFLAEASFGLKPSNFSKVASEFKQIREIMEPAGGSVVQWAKNGTTAAWRNGEGIAGMLSRLTTGKDPKGWMSMVEGKGLENMSVLGQLGFMGDLVWQTGHGMLGNMLKIEGLVNKVTGGESVKKDMPTWVEVIW
ncbi:hypothetical protein [Microbacterium album]|uniref:Uncharacterized protein n=1 Tax=Microbacterium album TaxID=2053191 RepID=A0A917IG33_9MICO|nr:hypothetical protein [Microbacterium album]GGH42908.1 hypothetical protein GCM10010921_16430 [Microbacterium album]